MKKVLLFIALTLALISCRTNVFDENETAEEETLNAEVSKMFELYSRAFQEGDEKVEEEFENLLQEYDGKYNSDLYENFIMEKNAAIDRLSGEGSYSPISSLPFNKDGAVYLSGGYDGILSAIITYVSPKSTRGKYYHAATLDLDKFDPTNLDSPCLHSAVVKGAGFETPNQWMRKPNVAVLYSRSYIDKNKLDLSQKKMDYYCDARNTNMRYGFFNNFANIFSATTKEDNYWWYCTKVVWRIYNELGINLDTNSSVIDWSSSGLYNFVKSYYKTIYFYDQDIAAAKLESYISNIKKTLIVADELYYSPFLYKGFEIIRN
ncbi:MAG TPA: hypothetical protein PK385_04915 [Spirochaetota bacterium]|nr:hypothetical protein [Spirochaetota bacterium]HOS33002.1 hypothetical protein [Spirochaetota bacterium]HOS55381.1 hypothetical protein [Spirochaetota bacterium]HPK62363.1 hypothetical protein [Spirochaetota bacterium]HQF77892.1 hypothetical protein [Spirochaetota bacterium]